MSTTDNAIASGLAQKIAKREVVVAVMGLGYVGLPLVRAAIAGGLKTIGYDIDPSKIEKLRRGETYIQPEDSAWLPPALASGKFVPTSDSSALREADAILICVPTPLSESRDPDLSYVLSTVREIAKTLRPGQLIALESTTYPSTTRDVMMPLLEQGELRQGEDYFLAYSPEREDPGNAKWDTHTIPKVVGGVGETSSQLAADFYRLIVGEVVRVSSAEVAEASKILENTYRAVNIALVNEMKILCDRIGIDVWEVIDAAKTKPFGFQAFYPGPGLGGHCIPIDPFYLTWVARKYGMTTRFIELAGEINTAMPEFVVAKLTKALNRAAKPVNGSKIAVLGVAYKPDVDDPRESPSFRLMELLKAESAVLSYSDPHIPSLPKSRSHNLPQMESQPLTEQYLAEQDCVLIATHHSAFDYDFVVRHSKLVIDTRNATKGVTTGREKIVRA